VLVIYGAGSIGLVLGARLARAGEDVLFVTRSEDAAARIGSDGVRLGDPASGESFVARARAAAGIDAAAPLIDDGPVVFCMLAHQTTSAADALARVAPDAVVASAQNGVHNDAQLARRFATVIGLVLRQTCTRTDPNAALASGTGRIVVGRHPIGCDRAARDLAARFERAGYDVGLSERIADDRWLKLCINLMSAPNALVRRADHGTEAFVETKARLLEEALKVLDANGIQARSGDGRDRPLDQEIAFQREALRRGTSARALPLYNQVWSSLTRGNPPEADGYHRLILDLASRRGVEAPTNQRVLDVLLQTWRSGAGPESVAAADLLA
jgi:2-dehydropantoate 2-reductase